jgi:L-ribulose-5-phosphate 3-epimerase
MKIAAFYETILDAVQQEHLAEEAVLIRLCSLGLQRIYCGYGILIERERELLSLFGKLGLEMEGLFQFYDWGNYPEDESYKSLIDLAKRSSAKNVLIVPGMTSTEDENQKKNQMDNMVTTLRQAVAYGKKQNIAVSMENFDGKEAPFCTIQGLKWYLDQVEGLQCSFDTGNFVVHGQNEIEAFDCMKDRICTIHLKDRAEHQHGKEDHAFTNEQGKVYFPSALGYGCIKIDEILKRLKDMNYQGNGIIEIFDSKQAMLNLEMSIKWLKEKIEQNNL